MNIESTRSNRMKRNRTRRWLLASFHNFNLPPIGRAACAVLLKRHDKDLTNLNLLNELNQP
jgi:hypothetical protein